MSLLPRRQPPVHSPLKVGAILAGLRGALRGDRSAGPRALERLLRERYGSAAVLLTDSGTSALALAIGALASERTRPVALPAYGCFDLATAADAAGAAVVLYDVDPGTLGPDLDSLARALRMGADRVVMVHLHGIPVDVEAVRALAEPFGARLVDDAAQGAGAAFGGRPLGAHGEAGILSFGRGKGVTGGGGGALLLRDDPALGERLDESLAPGGRGSARELVALAAQWALARPALYAIPASLPFLGLGETHYRPPHAAHRPSQLAVGVVRESFEGAEAEAALRRGHADRLRTAFAAAGFGIPGLHAAARPGYLRCPVVASAAARRAADEMGARRLGIMPGYPIALDALGGFGARRRNPDDAFPGARLLAERLVTLPTHAMLREPDLEALERWAAAR